MAAYRRIVVVLTDTGTVEMESCPECSALVLSHDITDHREHHDEQQRGPRKPPKPSVPRPIP